MGTTPETPEHHWCCPRIDGSKQHCILGSKHWTIFSGWSSFSRSDPHRELLVRSPHHWDLFLSRVTIQCQYSLSSVFHMIFQWPRVLLLIILSPFVPFKPGLFSWHKGRVRIADGKTEMVCGRFSRARTRCSTSHFCSYFIGQYFITIPYPTAGMAGKL